MSVLGRRIRRPAAHAPPWARAPTRIGREMSYPLRTVGDVTTASLHVAGLHIGQVGHPEQPVPLITVTNTPYAPLLVDGWAHPSPGVVPPIARGAVHLDVHRQLVTDVVVTDPSGEDATALWRGRHWIPGPLAAAMRRSGLCTVLVTAHDSSHIAGRAIHDADVAAAAVVASLRVHR